MRICLYENLYITVLIKVKIGSLRKSEIKEECKLFSRSESSKGKQSDLIAETANSEFSTRIISFSFYFCIFSLENFSLSNVKRAYWRVEEEKNCGNDNWNGIWATLLRVSTLFSNKGRGSPCSSSSFLQVSPCPSLGHVCLLMKGRTRKKKLFYLAE